MKLVALKRIRYPRGPDGKEYNDGDSFEASDRDAKALTLVRAAKEAPAEDKPRRGRPPKVVDPQPVTRAMSTEDAPIESAARYARRDFRAED